MRTSAPPAASAIGQVFPHGPRRPSSEPGCAPQIALETAPTARTVSSIGSRPETEMGTSPTPKTCTITNCPGPTRTLSASGSSVSVHVSIVSCRLAATRNGSGTNAPVSAAISGAGAGAIEVEESEMRPLEPFHQHLCEAADDVEAERRVGRALFAEAPAVELRRAHVR